MRLFRCRSGRDLAAVGREGDSAAVAVDRAVVLEVVERVGAEHKVLDRAEAVVEDNRVVVAPAVRVRLAAVQEVGVLAVGRGRHDF
jgi:hypothetical protein